MISAILAGANDEAGLALTLAALVPAATEGLVREAIFVDGGSNDGSATVADAAGCVILNGAGGDALRDSAAAAKAEWLLFIPPSSVLETGWQNEVMAFIDQAIDAGRGRQSAAIFRLGRLESGWSARRAEWLASFRSRFLAAPYAEQGLIISKHFYRSLGGHRELPAMADVDLARRIGRRRLTLLRTRVHVRQAAPKARRYRTPVRNAACLILFVLRLPPAFIGRLAG